MFVPQYIQTEHVEHRVIVSGATDSAYFTMITSDYIYATVLNISVHDFLYYVNMFEC